MFKKISENKAQYEKGQLFPLLIALIVVILIFIMITVNLGQINAFKTDVSNAADAGALAGASVLSGALLGLGLKSDQMAGFAVVALAAMTIFFMVDDLASAGISLAISWIVKGYVSWAMALGEGRMAWTNAKQTALSYAFNNAGVDEPRPTFREFMKTAYPIVDLNTLNASQTQDYYNRYSRGEVPGDQNETWRILQYSRSGFAKFMADNHQGYWSDRSFAKVDPSDRSPYTVKNGYGWNQLANGTFENSYCNANGNPYDEPARHRNFSNYLQVEVRGSSSYDIRPYFLFDVMCLAFLVNNVLSALVWLLQWLEHGNWIQGIVPAIVYTVIYVILVSLAPLGLEMDEDDEVDGHPLHLTVKRFKRESNLGLWNFRYGSNGVVAQAQGRAFNDTGSKTISSLFLEGICDPGALFSFDVSNLGDTRLHLFETELTYTK